MFKRKLSDLLAGLLMARAAMSGCNSSQTSSGDGGTSSESSSSSSSSGTEGGYIGSGDPSATTLEHWTFTELCKTFYDNMVTQWHTDNPDRLIRVNVNVLPYDDMHNKLQIALNSGTGAPDTVDIEVSKFSNFTEGDVPLMDMTSYAEPYKEFVVQSRLGLFSHD